MVVILATILFAGRFFDVNPVETLRLKTFDYYQKSSPRDITTDSVVLVEITEQEKSTGNGHGQETLLQICTTGYINLEQM